MPVILEKAKQIEYAIDKFLKAISYKEKVLRTNAKLSEAAYRYYLPFVDAYMKFTIDEINKAFGKRYIRKSDNGKSEYYAWIDFKKDKAIDITTNVLDWEDLDNTGVKMLKPATLEVMARSGNVANKIAGIEGAFDIVNPEAVKQVNKICSELVTNVGKNTKKAINQIIRQGIVDGKSMGKVAKEIRPLVGLTARQAAAVGKYASWLEIKRPELTALKRTKWVERYQNKLHRYRTELIARTESMRTVNEGQRLSYKDAGYKTLKWSANVGCCDLCADKDGHEFGIEEAEGMIPLHPACRCCWIHGSKKAKVASLQI